MSAGLIQHSPGFVKLAQNSQTVHQLESILADWFEADIILTSCGRSAILLYLSAAGLNRYKHRVVMPRMISACVLDAVIRRAFPVDAASAQYGDFSILYHQYGLPQQFRPKDEVHTLEDICHAFFHSEITGARSWAGRVAIFSIPKFFVTGSMIGGIIAYEHDLANRLRAARDQFSEVAKTIRQQHAKCLQENTSSIELERVYLGRLLNPRIEDDEIAGAPRSIEEIKQVADKRRHTLDKILSVLRLKRLGDDWHRLMKSTLPFACPVFGEPPELEVVNERLKNAGIVAGLYQIDRARNMTSPDYRVALLLPCHHAISEDKLDEACDVLRVVLR